MTANVRPIRRPAPPDNDPVLTESSIAALVVERFRDQLLYDHGQALWFEWAGTCWVPDTTGGVFDRCHTVVQEQMRLLSPKKQVRLGTAKFVSGVEKLCRHARTFVAQSEDWDGDPMVLGTPGGVVDLTTGKMRRAEPGDRITKQTAVAPADTADCPRFLRFLNEATGSDLGLMRFLQQWAGYSLTGRTTEHAVVFVFGGGGNGKSVYLKVLATALASYAATATMDAFVASKHAQHTTDLAMLKGARFVSASETQEGRAWDEARLKSFTGGDAITARFMHRDNMTFVPTCKITIVGNHKPKIRTVDEAMRRRLNIVPFIRKPAEPDPDLERKLLAELPGILRWPIDGCLDWQEHGLIRPDAVLAATDEYLADEDLFGQWVEDRCKVDPGNRQMRTPNQDLYASWCDFAERVGARHGTLHELGEKLSKLGLARYKSGGVRGFEGIYVTSTGA
ncbi:hypothetical protein M446_7040 (plasmid) [Methylobacterium sp. 4-46]|uniref:phage/plasmid primase, P4 family n=1 Tax=unclassified Methylobacterium TaxID=2615210 RepID=UPI000152D3E7|nr:MULTISPECIES: phage/plasmid primase, P4 family [Methylobacterium]ACA21258.1 hypothetical protein M446_7040 [Methylobacterium sp. 4-46]WFT83766.1 phage/plasmid primase, P4 family [Methylobacterium nodulans]